MASGRKTRVFAVFSALGRSRSASVAMSSPMAIVAAGANTIHSRVLNIVFWKAELLSRLV